MIRTVPRRGCHVTADLLVDAFEASRDPGRRCRLPADEILCRASSIRRRSRLNDDRKGKKEEKEGKNPAHRDRL